MPINARLVVVGGEVKTAEIKLRLPCTIGRGRGCTIMLPQALVSRQHCELFETDGQLLVRDLGSLNGTFVNNQKIAEPSPVRSEELLSIGTVTFRVVYDSAGASGPAPVPSPTDNDKPSQPLKSEDFDFQETVRNGSDTDSPSPRAGVKLPEKKAATVTVAAPLPKAAVAKPALPVAKPVVPAAATPQPAAPAAEEKGEEEDDFQDFLKSLGK